MADKEPEDAEGVFDVAVERAKKAQNMQTFWSKKRKQIDVELVTKINAALAEADPLASQSLMWQAEQILTKRKIATNNANIVNLRQQASEYFKTKEQYTLIYADPPWPYESTQHMCGTATQYGVMTMEQLAAMPVAGLANQDAVLVMWTTFRMLEQAVSLFSAWGFEMQTVFCVWVKVDRRGDPLYSMGRYTMPCAEFALFGTRGTMQINQRQEVVNSIVRSRPEEHSRKPSIVRDMIVRLFGDHRRIELFARVSAPDWDVWGNQTDLFVDDWANNGNDDDDGDAGTASTSVRPLPKRVDKKKQRNDRIRRIDRAGGALSYSSVTVGTSFGRYHAELDVDTQEPHAWKLAVEDHEHDGTRACCRPISDLVPESHLRNVTCMSDYLSKGTGGYAAVRNTLYSNTSDEQVRQNTEAIKQRQRHNSDLLFALNYNTKPKRARVAVATPQIETKAEE